MKFRGRTTFNGGDVVEWDMLEIDEVISTPTYLTIGDKLVHKGTVTLVDNSNKRFLEELLELTKTGESLAIVDKDLWKELKEDIEALVKTNKDAIVE